MKSGEITLPAAPPSERVEDLLDWAIPWLDPRIASVAPHLCWMIDNLAEALRTGIDVSLCQVLEGMPGCLLVPTLIWSSRSGGNPGPVDADAILRFLESKKDETSALRRLRLVARELKERGYEKNEDLWSRAKGPPARDIGLEGTAALLFGFISTAVTFIPIGLAIRNGLLSHWWWAYTFGLVFATAALVGAIVGFFSERKEKRGIGSAVFGFGTGLFSGLVGLLYLGLVPGALRRAHRHGIDLVFWALMPWYLFVAAVAFYSAFHLEGLLTWLWFLPAVIQLLASDVEASIDGDVRILIWQRSNPLLSLLHSLEESEV